MAAAIADSTVARFEQALHEHQGIVLKIAAIYARDAEDRADLAQDIRVQLWRAFPRYDQGQARLSTWLYRIALNVAISHLRRRNAPGLNTEPLQPRHLEVFGHDAPEHDERLDALRLLIGELDPFNRALIALYLDDRSYAQIGDILGISQTNVATRINRIKQTLRKQMTSSPSGA